MGAPSAIVATGGTVEVLAFIGFGLVVILAGLVASMRAGRSNRASSRAATRNDLHQGRETALADLAERVDALAGVVAATALVHQLEDKWERKRAMDVLRTALQRAETSQGPAHPLRTNPQDEAASEQP